ncbi:unnamed protein product [Protopolystoma xenopodis]|uniref:Neurotransmitter-gated ion-channel ligand-binding domain-containing protein n=1 Tax=Protopolystoma xenopodis TaxID=117903 RepID=A0A448WR13_9PLAT|nr:unnamed protein product [Protopolystoma xenopodis]
MWYDNRVAWDKDSYSGISVVNIPSKYIWLPDVGVMNGKSSTSFDFSSTSQSRIVINHRGVITWMHGAILDVTCPLDVSYFPFDEQICHIVVAPWHSTSDSLKIRTVQDGPVVDNSFLPNSNVSEWEIQDVNVTNNTYLSSFNSEYNYITINICLRRQPLYFIILVLVPFAMLSGLACLIFILDETGDRLSVALSLVLSMTMYVVIVSSNAPRSMRTLPVLG